MIQALAIAYAVVTFPYGDVAVAVSQPSVVNTLRVAVDVAESVVPFAPKARMAVAGLQIAELMAKHPAKNPVAEAQTFLPRGGRK